MAGKKEALQEAFTAVSIKKIQQSLLTDAQKKELLDAKIKKEKALANIQELKAKKLEGELIAKTEVLDQLKQFLQEIETQVCEDCKPLLSEIRSNIKKLNK